MKSIFNNVLQEDFINQKLSKKITKYQSKNHRFIRIIPQKDSEKLINLNREYPNQVDFATYKKGLPQIYLQLVLFKDKKQYRPRDVLNMLARFNSDPCRFYCQYYSEKENKYCSYHYETKSSRESLGVTRKNIRYHFVGFHKINDFSIENLLNYINLFQRKELLKAAEDYNKENRLVIR